MLLFGCYEVDCFVSFGVLDLFVAVLFSLVVSAVFGLGGCSTV